MVFCCSSGSKVILKLVMRKVLHYFGFLGPAACQCSTLTAKLRMFL